MRTFVTTGTGMMSSWDVGVRGRMNQMTNTAMSRNEAVIARRGCLVWRV